MSKAIQNYPINFGYGVKTTLANGQLYTHRGNDYPLRYEPVIVSGTQIGISGETGKAFGPHVHVQAGRDEWAQQTINPTPYVGKAGIVVKTGFASQWGSYVCLKVGTVNVFYCHLSKIQVSVGQIIKNKEVVTMKPNEVNIGFQAAFNRPAKPAEVKRYTGSTPQFFLQTLLNNNKGLRTKAANYDKLAASLKEYQSRLVTTTEKLNQVAAQADMTKKLQAEVDKLITKNKALEDEKVQDTATGNALVRFLGGLFNKG